MEAEGDRCGRRPETGVAIRHGAGHTIDCA